MQTSRHSTFQSHCHRVFFQTQDHLPDTLLQTTETMPSPVTPLCSHLLTPKSKSPNLSLFTLNRHRLISTTPRHRFPQSPDLPFGNGPSPPRLPKEEQELFESLQRQSTGAFSTPRDSPASAKRQPPRINRSPDSNTSDVADAESIIARRTDRLASASQLQKQQEHQQSSSDDKADSKNEFERIIEARGKGEELHPNVRRGADPEFVGEVNPRTGEVGGPKNEPLRWGSGGEWSYNGRTTDF